jgi:hypothetical protein
MRREALMEAVLKDAAAFERVVAALKAAFTRAWSLGHRNAVKRLLDEVQAIGPEAFTREMEARVLAAFEQEVGPRTMRRMVEGPVANLSEAAWLIGARDAAQGAGVDYRFGLKDKEALKLAQRGDLYWVANHWDAFTRQKLSAAVARFFEEGQTYERLAEWMREAMAGVHEAGMRYWELAADTAATKTREMGRIAGYAQAGIEWVQVRARMDERTTPCCRSLHGRLIPLRTIQAQRDKYLEAAGRGNLDAARAAWPMWDAGQAFGKEIPDNVGLPPYHFRCRTVTVAYLGRVDAQGRPLPDAEAGIDEVDVWRGMTWQREPLDRRDLGRLIERAMMARWDNGAYARRHLDKHAEALMAAGIIDARSLWQYNQALADLIRGPGRDILLSIRQGRLYAVFHREVAGGRVVAAVDVERLRLATLHVKASGRAASLRDEAVVEQGREARGIRRWFV